MAPGSNATSRQVNPSAQVAMAPPDSPLPQAAPCPTSPSQRNWGLQASGARHSPQLPQQPSSPQFLPAQSGTHSHCPRKLQNSDAAHVPQLPPQPSSPHCIPSQAGTQGSGSGFESQPA